MDGVDGVMRSRVFVNNHNTPFSTVTLPQSMSQRERNVALLTVGHPSRLISANGHFSNNMCRQTFEDTTDSALKKKVVFGGPGIIKEDLHPHLEDVYQRVMRKLQWKANYDDIGHISLAKEFGVVETLDVDKNKEKSDLDSGGHSYSVVSSSSTQTHAKGNVLKRRQYGRGIALSTGSTQQNDSVDDTAFLSQQPCPKTLRLVLEVVKNIIIEKLNLAENGSLKNCLCFVFESRSLLDRLLKEIPTYSHFQGEAERLPSTMQLQEMFQEFKQRPVVLPTAQYLKEATTGRVMACINEDMNNSSTYPMQSSNEHSTSFFSPRQESQGLLNTVVNKATNVHMMTGDSSHVMMVGSKKKIELQHGVSITIPPTYGKSVRERTANNRQGQSLGGVFSRTLSKFPTANPTSDGGVKKDGVHNFVLNNKGGGDAAARLPGLLLTDPSLASAQEVEKEEVHFSPKGKVVLDEKRKATQMISVATLTEINATNIVSRVEYDKLLAHIEELMVEIEELKQETQNLQEQLDEERDYTTQKRKVVQYLRETLYKECSILRSQISIAEQKKIRYQILIKEQQSNPMAQSVSVPNADTRNGLASSVSESSCLPSLCTRLTTNELSTLTTSFARAASGTKRKNFASFSVIGSQQVPTGLIEDHDEICASTTGSGVVVGSAQPPRRLSVDITAVQSLLDLVLLAVENDQVLPANSSKAKSTNINLIANAMKDDGHKREMELKKEFTERERQIKHYFAASRAETASKLALKDSQIERLKSFSNIRYLYTFWKEKSAVLRTELKRIRSGVLDDLQSLGRFVFATMDSIANRARVVDTTLGDNHMLYTTQLALRDIISSAESLLLPMLSNEYGRGYHPWPLKLRNTVDPFGQLVKARYGEQQLVSVRGEINALSSLYLAAHRYVMKNQITLNVKRPMVGKSLQMLCSLLILNSSATNDMWTRVRSKYIEEREFEKKIAQLNISIVFFMYRQRIMTERSFGAMYDAGMDPRLIGLPAQHSINQIAHKLRELILERTQLRKQRHDNAREVYRLWKKECIDIYEGYPSPSPPQRLVAVEMEALRGNLSSSALFDVTKPRVAEAQKMLLNSERKSREFWDATLLTRENSGKSNIQRSELETEDEGTTNLNDDLTSIEGES